MDDAVKHLARLLRSGAITPQTYAEGLSALAETPPTPALRQQREPPTPAPRQRRERPTPAPRQRRPIPGPRDVPTAEMDAYIEGIHDQSKCSNRKHFCERCLHGYTREDLLEAHKPECCRISQTASAVRVEMPEEGENKLAFQNLSKPPQAAASPLHHLRRLRGSHHQSRDLSSTPQRATLRGHNTMMLVVIATSSFGVTARQSRQSNIAAQCSRALLRITAGRRAQNQGRAS